MRKNCFLSALFVAALVGASAANAAFPVAVGSCKDRACFFTNDQIKTRTVGANADKFFVETLNTHVRNRFGDRERELAKVGDSFFQRYSANTLNQIYATNDTFVTDQKAHDRALKLYERGLSQNNQGLIRAAEVQARQSTVTGGSIIAVIGHNQPFQLFPTTKQQVPGTDAKPVHVGFNPGNVFAPGVRDLGEIRPGPRFDGRTYDRLNRRYLATTALQGGWQSLLEKRLKLRAQLIAAGKSTARIDANIRRNEERIATWGQRGQEAAENAIHLIAGGSSSSTIDGALAELLGKSFDTSVFTTLVDLDLFSAERWGRGAFEQFFPIDKLVDGKSAAFSYVSLIKDHRGRIFIGFGVVSQHNRFVAGNV